MNADSGTVAAVRVHSLSCRLGGHPAVDDVSFELEPGRALAIMGQNAAGKSTLLAALAGVLRPTAGQVELAGGSAPWVNPDLRRRIGYLAQQPALYPDLTVEDHLRSAARVFGLAQATAIEQALAEHELGPMRRRLVARLSGGYRRRLGLAIAMIHDPDLLLLDEPASAMDPGQREKLYGRLRDLGVSQTLVFTSHRVEEALELADDVLVLFRGRVAHLGPAGVDESEVLVRVARDDFPQLDCVLEAVALDDGRYRVKLRMGAGPSDLMAALAASGTEVASVVSGREARSATLLRLIAEGRE